MIWTSGSVWTENAKSADPINTARVVFTSDLKMDTLNFYPNLCLMSLIFFKFFSSSCKRQGSYTSLTSHCITLSRWELFFFKLFSFSNESFYIYLLLISWCIFNVCIPMNLTNLINSITIVACSLLGRKPLQKIVNSKVGHRDPYNPSNSWNVDRCQDGQTNKLGSLLSGDSPIKPFTYPQPS